MNSKDLKVANRNRCNSVVLLLIFLAGLNASCGEGNPDVVKKQPVPDAEALKKATKQVHDDFAEDYTKKAYIDSRKFAMKLIVQARNSKDDPAMCYTLLSELATLRAKQSSLCEVLIAIQLMRDQFEIDNVAVTKNALTSFTVPRDDKLTEKALAALRALFSKPDDAVQNLIVGRYLLNVCSTESALPYLSKCSDATLKKLAVEEISVGTAPTLDVMMQLGDSWWDLGEREANKNYKTNLWGRAIHWYEMLSPIANDVTKAKAEKRIVSFFQFVGIPRPIRNPR
ncbi:MAG: hypothetical protein WCT04_08255 [Planctomycetota bacterium]